MLKEFASFHNHSHYSVFDGLSLPEELIRAAKDKGLKSIALTDHGVLHGVADFFLQGKKIGGPRIVFGVEAYVIHDLTEWKAQKAQLDSQKRKGARQDDTEYADDGDVVDSKTLRRKGHLVLLACNREGLSNLYQLTFKAHKYGFYGKPRMDKAMLREHARGLIATSACMGGVISKRLWDLKEGAATWDEVRHEVLDYDDVFGRGRFFLELQFNEMDREQNYINTSLVQLSRETGVPLTVTTDSHYSKQEEWEPRELLHLMGWSKKTVQDLPEQRLDSKVKQLYVKSPEEMWLTYERLAGHVIDQKTATEAFQGTLLIDSLIEDFEPDTHQRLPTLPYKNPYREMGERAIAGLKKLGLASDDEYKDRLLFELGVIKQKGIANYFLVCQQIIEEAKKHMLVGPGRGSAAGSLVCWCLGITDLDPLKHDLLFERFLDIDRAELPDIDTDFEDPQAAKRMLQEMFGADNVASLSSYGTFQIKGLLKDLGRVYGLDHNVVNKVNRAIDKELKVLYKDQDKSTLVVKLDDIVRVSPTFNSFVEQNPELGSKIKTLYGRIRHVTRHAAGVIIGDNLPAETSCFVAKAKGKKKSTTDVEGEDDILAEEGEMVVQTSFTEGIVNKNLSAMGFVKMDLLGLANLRVIHEALRLISGKTGQSFDELQESIRSHRMDLDDMTVMKNIFWKGNFGAIFQFTNPGIRALAKQVRPDSFVDISAIVSLYRPGPLKGGYHKVYVHAKHGETVSLGHPVLDELLGKTKGCLVFQEQLMKVCSKFGKMTGKEVNRVRKVLLKKDKSKTEEFLKKENDELFASFKKGCDEHGFPPDRTLKLWEDIKAFGGYAFNKSHSDAYSVVTMQTAHLATYHPLEFYTAALTKAQANAIQTLVADIQKTGVRILPVDINRSKGPNSIEDGKIRLCLSRILGVGPAVVEKILAGQPYADFQDFLDRSRAGRGAVEPLIMVGAFSSLPGCGNIRRLENVYQTWCQNVYVTVDGELKSFTEKPEGLPVVRVQSVKGRPRWEELSAQIMIDESVQDYALHEKVFFENQLMEFSLVGSPFEILDRKKKIQAAFDGVVVDYQEFIDGDKEVAMLPVVVKDIKEKPQRNGQMFAFVKFATEDGVEFDSPCFGNIWRHVGPRMRKGSVYVVTFNRREEDPENLLVGKPGWAHSSYSANEAVINVDDISL